MHRPSRSSGQRRTRTGVLIAILVLAALLLVACGAPDTDPDALLNADGTPRYRDGRYAAAYSHPDADGWRSFLLVRIRAGLIREICFDAVNADGERMLESEGYLETYRLETSRSAASVLEELAGETRERQSPPVSAAPGAVAWSTRYLVLLERALEAARVGLTLDAAGIEVVPTPGPYVATDAPDELGWRGELVLIFDGDGPAAGSFREVRTRLDGTTIIKREDADYQERFAAASGLVSPEVSRTLLEQVVEPEGGSAEVPQIDAVTGATLSSSRFAALLAHIYEQRTEAPLPNRLCP